MAAEHYDWQTQPPWVIPQIPPTLSAEPAPAESSSANNVTIPQPIVSAGRANQTSPAHIINVSGANTISGQVSFATSGNSYVVQSNPGSGNKLTLSNSVVDNLDTDRFLILTGGGDGEVSGGVLYTYSGTGTGSLGVVKDGTGT